MPPTMKRARPLLGAGLVVMLAACSGSTAPPTANLPTATPAPLITAIPVIETGVITFGLDLDEETLTVLKPRTTFKTTAKAIAWSASLSEQAGAPALTFVLARVRSGGAEALLIKRDVDLSDPSFDLLGNKLDLATLVGNRAGTYVMRYLRDKDVLAEGKFTLTK